jgi:hypothetical protein
MFFDKRRQHWSHRCKKCFQAKEARRVRIY